MVGAVKEEGGSVHHFTGDGIMALFGVPNALGAVDSRDSL
jgi:class 3 adenylate cyclase